MGTENTKRLWGSAKAGLSPSMTYFRRRELMPQGISPSMQRLVRRKLSRVLGGQAQVISLKEIKRKGEWQGYCEVEGRLAQFRFCLLYTSPSPRDMCRSRMPSSA